MKKFFSLLTLCFFAFLLNAGARVWRVNNNTGIQADFNNVAAAVTAANAGDTIYLESTAAAYGPITLTKRLVIIGTGFFLNEAAANPKTQYNNNSSTVSFVNMNAGSKGSVVQGLVITGGVTMDDSLLTLQRCYLSTVTVAATRNVADDTIRQCYMTWGVVSNNVSFRCDRLLIYNNIINSSVPLSFNTNNLNNINGYFINNSLVYSGSNNFNCVNFVFQNNIIPNVTSNSYTSSNVFYNNITGNAVVSAANGNVLNASMGSVYEGWNSGAGMSSDARFKLKTGSPAIGAGMLNGSAVDCGAFGGPAPYVLSGMPSIPSIYYLDAPAQVVSGTPTINVTLSAAAH